MQWVKWSETTLDFRTPDGFLERLAPRTAAKYAVESIMQTYPEPYHIMISGGIDSQVMLYAWYKFGKNYIPTTVVYNEGLNSQDINNVKEFTKPYNIEVYYKKFNLLSFLLHEYDSYSAQFRCSSPCISAHIKMVEDLPGTIIFSGDFLSPQGAKLTDAILGLYRASLARPTIIPYFFLYSPELAYSMLHKKLDPLRFYSLDDYNQKVFMYRENGFPIVPQDNKTSGFEQVKDYYDLHFRELVPPKNRLKYAHKRSKRTFDLLHRYPYEEKYQDQEFTFLMNPID